MAEQNKWQNILDLLSATGNFYRPKGPKTKIRLVPMPKGSEEFFHEVQSTFRGNTKTKYILSGLVIDGKGAREEMAHTVTPIIVSKVVLKGILGLLAEGYDLLDEESGFGLVINRAGEGLNTTYAVMPSKSAQPLPANLDRGEQDLPQMAAAYEAWNSQSRNSRATEDDDGEGGPHNEPEW